MFPNDCCPSAEACVCLDWDGQPPGEGWHWLRRKGTGGARMAYWSRRTSWRVADAIGRTVIRSELKVSQLFTYERPVPNP